jgi:hypothetical protein
MSYIVRPYLPAREVSDAAMCLVALDPVSLLRRAPALPRIPCLQILPHCSEGLRHCHVSHGSRSCLPAREGSDAATCPTAPDHASLIGMALALARVPRLWIRPPYSRGLQCCHVSHNTRPRLPAQEGFDAAMCPVTLCWSQMSRIKKGLAGLHMRLGSCVFMACPHVTETSDT